VRARSSSSPAMSKGLSNGTLSLRFMRNAHGGAPASLTQAAIADDGAWEVPAAVRAAWAASGPPRCALRCEAVAGGLTRHRDVEHESSYVPFMPAERGRRTFGANGREVIPSAAPPVRAPLPPMLYSFNRRLTRKRRQKHRQHPRTGLRARSGPRRSPAEA
jgi:hypothetical protein